MSGSLAVKYRPRRFGDVAGQQHVVAVLRSAAKRERPPQQILLAGPSGLGKTTTARIFAAALLCEHRTEGGDGCGLCRTCLQVTGPDSAHPDVVELDAASNGGKDEIRDLAKRAALAPMWGKWKVFIVDEAHGLTGHGGQAFLRLLEEPPAHCLFVLATTDPEKLPAALRGRCVTLEVLPPTVEEISANLRRIAAGEDWEVTDEIIDAVVAASDPALGMRGTVTTFDKLSSHLSDGLELTGDELEELLGVISPVRLNGLFSAILGRDVAGAVAALAELDTAPGRVHLRQQITSWAYQKLKEKAGTGGDVAEEFYRYATLVEAPNYEGALTVAVARIANPVLANSVESVQALLAQATSVAAGQPLSPASEPASPVDVSGANEVQQAIQVATAPTTAPVGQPEGGSGTEVQLTVQDPEFLELLNATAKVSSPATLSLRRCNVFKSDSGLRVEIPDSEAARAQRIKLVEVLATVTTPAGPIRVMGQ